MLDLIMKALGVITKQERKQVQLPEGLSHLEVIPAKGWWH